MTNLKTILDEFDKKFKEYKPYGEYYIFKDFLISSIKKALEEVEVEEITKTENENFDIKAGHNGCCEMQQIKMREFLKL